MGKSDVRPPRVSRPIEKGQAKACPLFAAVRHGRAAHGPAGVRHDWRRVLCPRGVYALAGSPRMNMIGTSSLSSNETFSQADSRASNSRNRRLFSA